MSSSSAPLGLLITASKVHVPFKTELLSTMASERFVDKPPHLVGILATKKDDARTYAEVSVLKWSENIHSLTFTDDDLLSCSSPRKHASR